MEHKVWSLKGGNRAVKMLAESKLRMKGEGEYKKEAQYSQFRVTGCHPSTMTVCKYMSWNEMFRRSS